MAFLHHWKDLCKAMARPELVDDPKLGTDAGRLANRADMIKLIEDWLATFPDRDSVIVHLQQNAVPAAVNPHVERYPLLSWTNRWPPLIGAAVARCIPVPPLPSPSCPSMRASRTRFSISGQARHKTHRMKAPRSSGPQ